MRRSVYSPEPDCAIAQALGVVGDWDLLIVRDLARGVSRFDALLTSVGISRKVLASSLASLVAQGIVARTPYQSRPVRYGYSLTPQGVGLVPVLVALQDWGDRWLLGDGSLTGTDALDAAPAHRLHGLVGTPIPPELLLPATTGDRLDVVDPSATATVIFCYPATGRPTPLPSNWSDIPGAHGCTLENRLFASEAAAFADAGVAVHGVSTQRPDEQKGFAALEDIPHLLLSDQDLALTAALRLPTFRAADTERLKRVILIATPDRVIRAVRYPILDIPEAISWSLTTARGLVES